jgi:gas vesicle protein
MGRRSRQASRRGGRRSTLVGGLLGAALAFLFDPQLGRRRRTGARKRVVGTLRRLGRRGNRFSRHVGSQSRGYVARVHHATPEERLHPDDATLTQKVESELFRPADVPKGQINVNVQNGVVQLRGEVPQPEMIDDLVEKARQIGGVRDVENLLHLPGTAPPMHQ